jgi:rhamnosyl/mannosyltransferase
VLPSLDRSETFGVVQLEAMASGVPVIASDLPTGVREVGLPDRTCLLVKPGDPLALREAMRRLLTDPSLAEAMGEQARCRFQAEFTQDRMLARLVAWYRGILDSPTGGVR